MNWMSFGLCSTLNHHGATGEKKNQTNKQTSLDVQVTAQPHFIYMFSVWFSLCSQLRVTALDKLSDRQMCVIPKS